MFNFDLTILWRLEKYDKDGKEFVEDKYEKKRLWEL